eukprot:7141580-Prymnesium_polylepis.1
MSICSRARESRTTVVRCRDSACSAAASRGLSADARRAVLCLENLSAGCGGCSASAPRPDREPRSGGARLHFISYFDACPRL